MRILLVSQFWPGPADPDLGAFLVPVVEELERRGHTIDRAVVDRRGAGRRGDARMALRSAAARRADVVFAHFLVPAGLVAAVTHPRTPLVVMAHGQDVRNAVASAPIRRATALVARRAHTTIFNSAHLRDQMPVPVRRAEVVDLGIDLDRWRGADAGAARERLGLAGEPGPVFLFAGSLVDRKNLVRLRDAFAAFGRGTLVVLGDGPLRAELEGRERVRLEGRVPHEAVREWVAACDALVLPSLEEPLGQALLEAMASERSVVATQVGGPPEFVTPEAGALVDPLSVESIRAGLEHAAALPAPNAAARRAAEPHALQRQVERMEAVLHDAASNTEQ
ncbi:MAG TPA: glycosyltransferase [Solirubrobacteraceae bacterium]|jgi:glycosyltransferase involved in cell wall biosynthesis|nr:glycosyltransferase [Solirubrobacteraceae bacterium]